MKCSWYIWWVVAGVYTGVSLSYGWFWALVVPGLFLQLYLVTQTHQTKKVFLGALCTYVTHMLIVHGWFWGVDVPAVLGFESSSATYSAVAGALLIIATFSGVGYAAVIAFFHYVIKKNVRWWLVIFPVAVLVGELVGRLVLSIGTLGSDGGLNVSYGIGHYGYALVEHQLFLQLALFVGVYSATFFVSLLAVGVWLVRRQFWVVVSIGCVLLVSAQWQLSYQPLPEEVSKTALMSLWISPEEQQDLGFAEVVDFNESLTRVVDQGYTAIIFPEDSRYLARQKDEFNAMTIVDSGRVSGVEGPKLRAYIHDAQTNSTYEHDKQYLVPLGEYVPYVAGSLLRILGLSEGVDKSHEVYGYTTGKRVNEREFTGSAPVVLFCYESVVPYATYVRTKNIEQPYVAHIVSHSWFGSENEVLNHQLSAMLRLQAVWSNTYILQSANMSETAVVTPRGHYLVGPEATPQQPVIVVGVDAVFENQKGYLY